MAKALTGDISIEVDTRDELHCYVTVRLITPNFDDHVHFGSDEEMEDGESEVDMEKDPAEGLWGIHTVCVSIPWHRTVCLLGRSSLTRL